MATVHCSKCTAERKGFRRELDSWRHKLIHCIGFESILEGIYGPLLLRDLNVFDDCEPEEVTDWSPEGNGSQCSFCNLPLDKLNDQVLSATSPLSSPSDYSPRHVPTLSESSQSAHRFLQAVFHKKDVPLDCDPNIPLIAQELMTKMIRQFAMEYASKCLLHTTANGVPTRTSSPQSETSDAPLDLTVSRAPEEKESQPDGVLDLSSRKSACLPTSKSSVSSTNHKASGGCQTTITQETGEPGQQGTKYHNSSALGAVFNSLCPVHRSLLFQILKLAHQQKLLFFKNLKPVQSESYCCHCGLNFEDHVQQVKVSDCKVENNSHLWPSVCDNCSTRYHPKNSKSTFCTNHYHPNECRSKSSRDSNCCAVPRCTIICPERVHFSCQSLSLSDFKSTSPLVCTSSLCSLSICCSQHNQQSCFCHLNHSCISQDKSTASTEKSDISSVLKREHSPSPPPLSPIPSDLNKQTEERPPSLLDHIQREEAKPAVKNGLFNTSHKVTRQKSRNTYICKSKNKSSGTLVQDVVNQFSEKLETIKPLANVPLAIASEAEMEPLQVASTNVPLDADAHLTEIITTVLHTGAGRAGEYNLQEFINDRDNDETKSPNTRSRRRQEVLAAMATPADATARRHSLQIKRKAATLGQSCNEHIRAKLKYAKNLNTSFANIAKENCKRDVLDSKSPNMPHTGTNDSEMKDDIQAAIKTELIEAELFEESHLSIQGNNCTVTRCENRADCSKNVQCPPDQKEARKSKRKIVPPTRFSSYVTEPRTKYFVACFSDGIFTQGRRKYVIAPPNPDYCDSESTSEYCTRESLNADCETKAISLIATDQNHTEDNPDKLTDCRNVAKRYRRSQPEKRPTDVITTPSPCIESPLNPCFEYTSPIKLMFVSPVKDEEGIKYSLKSAAVFHGSQSECFDPCEESSWSGTPEKNKGQSPELTTPKSSHLKTVVSPKKTVNVSPRSSPNKTSPTKPSSPAKSVSSPKSSTSSPKAGSRRSGESTPTKRLGLDETQRSPRDVPLFHETTPPKRRPGRPKKLGPQLENKVKRPIGRPRKDKSLESAVKEKLANGNPVADTEENVNKNLKITVVYGRSRRNKRMVSEGFDQLQTEFRDACQAVGLNKNWSMLMNTAKDNSGDLKTASVELSQEFPLVRPVKDCASHSKTNIKCQSLEDSVPSRKPGRPAKVKISGISVTVTTVSPRQRRIQINRENKASPIKQTHKRALLQEFKSPKELKTITCHSVGNSSQQEQETEEAKAESIVEHSNPPIAVRHSERVRKPSIHFLHAVASSSSYSRSSALVRRSKQVLLNKANNERKKEESQSIAQTSGEKKTLKEQEKDKSDFSDLQLSAMSIDSIYSPKETLKWWAASAQEKTLNQELARRIRLISDTWVTDPGDKEAELSSNMGVKCSSPCIKKTKHSSVVRSLFDCSPNKPRSCSMQQLRSWFMQTTETQSLSIVKKASSRNPYELLHFPRSTNKKSFCYSPQAERLRKHLKKFAKSVPKSPYDFQQTQKMINEKKKIIKQNLRPWYFPTTLATGSLYQNAKRSKSFIEYQVTLFRAKRRFLTGKQRKSWMNYKTRPSLNGHITVQPKQKALLKLTAKHLPCCGQTLEPVHASKDHLCSKAWSSEKLKECRVFLRKINSPDNKTAEEKEDSCTVTMGEGSPSELLFDKSKKQTEDAKAVKTRQKRRLNRVWLRHPHTLSPISTQKPHMMPMRGRRGRHRAGVVSESTQPPPAKILRQSRMKGLSGPKWRDFVFGN